MPPQEGREGASSSPRAAIPAKSGACPPLPHAVGEGQPCACARQGAGPKRSAAPSPKARSLLPPSPTQWERDSLALAQGRGRARNKDAPLSSSNVPAAPLTPTPRRHPREERRLFPPPPRSGRGTALRLRKAGGGPEMQRALLPPSPTQWERGQPCACARQGAGPKQGCPPLPLQRPPPPPRVPRPAPPSPRRAAPAPPSPTQWERDSLALAQGRGRARNGCPLPPFRGPGGPSTPRIPQPSPHIPLAQPTPLRYNAPDSTGANLRRPQNPRTKGANHNRPSNPPKGEMSPNGTKCHLSAGNCPHPAPDRSPSPTSQPNPPSPTARAQPRSPSAPSYAGCANPPSAPRSSASARTSPNSPTPRSRPPPSRSLPHRPAPRPPRPRRQAPRRQDHPLDRHGRPPRQGHRPPPRHPRQRPRPPQEAAVNSVLRSIERYLICQVAQVALLPIAEDYVERWKRALRRREPLPDVTDIFSAAAAVRIPTLAPGPLVRYIGRCGVNDAVPDPGSIVKAFLHGRAANDLTTKTCRCPRPRAPNQPPPPPRRTACSPLPHAVGEGQPCACARQGAGPKRSAACSPLPHAVGEGQPCAYARQGAGPKRGTPCPPPKRAAQPAPPSPTQWERDSLALAQGRGRARNAARPAPQKRAARPPPPLPHAVGEGQPCACARQGAGPKQARPPKSAQRALLTPPPRSGRGTALRLRKAGGGPETRHALLPPPPRSGRGTALRLRKAGGRARNTARPAPPSPTQWERDSLALAQGRGRARNAARPAPPSPTQWERDSLALAQGRGRARNAERRPHPPPFRGPGGFPPRPPSCTLTPSRQPARMEQREPMGDELEFNPWYGNFPYTDFIKAEGIPLHEAYAVDCHTVAVEPWERLGGLGAYVHVAGTLRLPLRLRRRDPPRRRAQPRTAHARRAHPRRLRARLHRRRNPRGQEVLLRVGPQRHLRHPPSTPSTRSSTAPARSPHDSQP